jgi:hypothetical protein
LRTQGRLFFGAARRASKADSWLLTADSFLPDSYFTLPLRAYYPDPGKRAGLSAGRKVRGASAIPSR